MRYPGRREVRSLWQTCSELEFGLSSSSLAASLHELAGLRQVCDQHRPVCDQDSVMKFGFEPACDQVRAGSSYLEPGRRPVRSWSKPNFIALSWSQTGRCWSQTCRRPASSCKLAASELDDRPNSSSLRVCDHIRTCLRSDSVMEFGFNYQLPRRYIPAPENGHPSQY